MTYETIAHVADPSLARVLIAALQAHGFHPIEADASGLPGLPGVVAPKGIPIRLPVAEASDARLLAEDLLRQMLQR